MLQLQEVRAATNVASQCGKCACVAKQVVRETLTELQVSQAALPTPWNLPQPETKNSKNRTLRRFFYARNSIS